MTHLYKAFQLIKLHGNLYTQTIQDEVITGTDEVTAFINLQQLQTK
jgi:hypothetical protein